MNSINISPLPIISCKVIIFFLVESNAGHATLILKKKCKFMDGGFGTVVVSR